MQELKGNPLKMNAFPAVNTDTGKLSVALKCYVLYVHSLTNRNFTDMFLNCYYFSGQKIVLEDDGKWENFYSVT